MNTPPAELVALVHPRAQEHLSRPRDPARHPFTVLESRQVVEWYPDDTYEVSVQGRGKLQREVRHLPVTLSSLLADAFALIERHDLRVCWIFVAPDYLEALRASTLHIADGDRLWGAAFAVCQELPTGHVVVTSDLDEGELPPKRVSVIVPRA